MNDNKDGTPDGQIQSLRPGPKEKYWKDFFERITPRANGELPGLALKDFWRCLYFWRSFPRFLRELLSDGDLAGVLVFDLRWGIAHDIIMTEAEKWGLNCIPLHRSGKICQDIHYAALSLAGNLCPLGDYWPTDHGEIISAMKPENRQAIMDAEDTLTRLGAKLKAAMRSDATGQVQERQDDPERGSSTNTKAEKATLGKQASAREIAKAYGLPYLATRKRLQRLRKKDFNCFHEVQNVSSQEPRFLYWVARVNPVIKDLQAKYSKSHD